MCSAAGTKTNKYINIHTYSASGAYTNPIVHRHLFLSRGVRYVLQQFTYIMPLTPDQIQLYTESMYIYVTVHFVK